MSASEAVHDQATKGWSSPSVPDFYEKNRPSYNLGSVEFLLEKVGAFNTHSQDEPFTIVELGAGTGKFTRAVLKVLEKRAVENVKIISTEPLKEMCKKFKEMVPNVELLQRPANNLTLPSCSADAILAAQSFHWFAADMKSITEIHRVLKCHGMLGAIWNLPDQSVSWIKAIEQVFLTKYKQYNIPRPETCDIFYNIKDHGGFGQENSDDSYKISMELDLQGVIDRYKSVSVVSAAKGDEKEAMLAKIENEMKTNPDVKNQDVFCFNYVVKIRWVQKRDQLIN